MASKWYQVCPDRVPAIYKPGFFPRKFAARRQALEMAASLLRDPSGVTKHVRIEYSDGAELDLTPETISKYVRVA